MQMMQRRAQGRRLKLALLIVLFMDLAGAQERRSFSVRDSVEMTKVLNFGSSEYAPNRQGATALFSPDKSRLVIRTSQADIGRDVVNETLRLFDATEIETLLKDSASTPVPPAGEVLATVSISRVQARMSNIVWLNDREMAFLAQGPNRFAQVFVADAGRKTVRQLTQSSADVLSFAVSGDTLLYYVKVSLPAPPSVTVSGQSLDQLLDSEALWWAPPVRLYRLAISSGQVTPIDIPTARRYRPFQKIWISPDAHYAVIFAPTVDAPRDWARYRLPRYDVYGYTPQRVQSDPMSTELIFRARYFLVDLSRNTSRALLDAPSGWLTFNLTPMDVFWPAEGRSVIVTNTFLPLTGRVPKSQAAQREMYPAIAEIDLLSGNAVPIAWEVSWDGKGAVQAVDGGITAVSWSGGQQSLAVRRRGAAFENSIENYSRAASFSWRRRLSAVHEEQSSFVVQRRESLNERPKVFATGGACGCTRLMFDPEPAADSFSFARVETVRWKDANGIEWKGGVVFPRNFIPGRRYPLVVQTHGFDADGFLLDGYRGTATAMAAQALASSGIMVLQIEDNAVASKPMEAEAARYAEGYRAGIEYLTEREWVDADRVGLIAFSRTGLYAIRLIADHPELLAAVTIADAAWWGYLSDLVLLNMPEETAAESRGVTGLSADNLNALIDHSPLYKLAPARAAFRLEAIGPLSLIVTWEHYATLKSAGRAVDFVYFPQGSHNLFSPKQRFQSQQGNVEWFIFWLKASEVNTRATEDELMRWGQEMFEAQTLEKLLAR